MKAQKKNDDAYRPAKHSVKDPYAPIRHLSKGYQHRALECEYRNACLGKGYVSQRNQLCGRAFSGFDQIVRRKRDFRKGIYRYADHCDFMKYDPSVLHYGEDHRSDERNGKKHQHHAGKLGCNGFFSRAKHAKANGTEQGVINSDREQPPRVRQRSENNMICADRHMNDQTEERDLEGPIHARCARRERNRL